jgi:hypothetical protein
MTLGTRVAEVDQVKVGAEHGANHEEVHSRFMDDLSKPLSQRQDKQDEFYQAKPEYRNGLASEKLLAVEKWAQDEKLCNLKGINQDQLADKLTKFAKETGEMWKKMEDRPKDLGRLSKDEWMTYPRFQKLVDALDDQHKEKIRKDIPWHLAAGE